jgi:hypothetical protein
VLNALLGSKSLSHGFLKHMPVLLLPSVESTFEQLPQLTDLSFVSFSGINVWQNIAQLQLQRLEVKQSHSDKVTHMLSTPSMHKMLRELQVLRLIASVAIWLQLKHCTQLRLLRTTFVSGSEQFNRVLLFSVTDTLAASAGTLETVHLAGWTIQCDGVGSWVNCSLSTLHGLHALDQLMPPIEAARHRAA